MAAIICSRLRRTAIVVARAADVRMRSAFAQTSLMEAVLRWSRGRSGSRLRLQWRRIVPRLIARRSKIVRHDAARRRDRTIGEDGTVVADHGMAQPQAFAELRTCFQTRLERIFTRCHEIVLDSSQNVDASTRLI